MAAVIRLARSFRRGHSYSLKSPFPDGRSQQNFVVKKEFNASPTEADVRSPVIDMRESVAVQLRLVRARRYRSQSRCD